MAEVFSHDGLKLRLNDWPRAATSAAATLYVGLFCSQSPTEVMSATLNLESATEVSGGGYVRQAIPAASWLTPTSVATGVRVIGAQVSFPETTGAYSPTHGVNGWFLCDSPTITTSGMIAQANFDDGAPVVVNSSGIVIRVTPIWHTNP